MTYGSLPPHGDERRFLLHGARPGVIVGCFRFLELEPLTMARARIPQRRGKACGTRTSAAACPATLVEETLHLPRREAARWRHTPLDLEELVADGNVGLAKAARRYDPTRNVSFAAFATPYVRGAITDSVRDKARHRRLQDGSFVDVVGFDEIGYRGDGFAGAYEPPDLGPTPPETFESLEKLRILGTLPDRERVALVRTIVDGETAADVGKELGVGADRIYSLVHTGSARLRRRAA